uniref:Uncharacterized protein n=1 Tax=Chromera velia CCMP2878 TaxID=1169474 RepID=A0A0G4H455_9ALVE|eukprot:Cvel_24593.t1-p1 / transcript=Cvel_24593.t1 / gene=Cvel_24593 / organism=Chromera_velia_CCMP2878 / gene_product=hypothetical protein / transcript_product=hypothetical protein / location=Cvel_scaffold2678:6460-10696(+) / protein_length=161 / sequence_SO=supercontig / SO=protein_coding / is_pseudo=false
MSRLHGFPKGRSSRKKVTSSGAQILDTTDGSPLDQCREGKLQAEARRGCSIPTSLISEKEGRDGQGSSHPSPLDSGRGEERGGEEGRQEKRSWRVARESRGSREERRGEARRGCPIPAPSMVGVERRGEEASFHSSPSQPFVVRRGKKTLKWGEILLFQPL